MPKQGPVQKFAQSIAQPVAQAVVPPVQAAQPQQPQGFRYRMGSSDYSDIAPQVQNALKGTPLEPYANEFIQAGNRHKVDPRVLVTVANNESSLGRNYNPDTYNPFGYVVNPPDYGNTTGKAKSDLIQMGLKNAGFTSLPMAIDRLTQRFSTQPVNPTGAGYQTFRQDPTVENLQAAYNANPKEAAGWIQNGKAITSNFQ